MGFGYSIRRDEMFIVGCYWVVVEREGKRMFLFGFFVYLFKFCMIVY